MYSCCENNGSGVNKLFCHLLVGVELLSTPKHCATSKIKSKLSTEIGKCVCLCVCCLRQRNREMVTDLTCALPGTLIKHVNKTCVTLVLLHYLTEKSELAYRHFIFSHLSHGRAHRLHAQISHGHTLRRASLNWERFNVSVGVCGERRFHLHSTWIKHKRIYEINKWREIHTLHVF